MAIRNYSVRGDLYHAFYIIVSHRFCAPCYCTECVTFFFFHDEWNIYLYWVIDSLFTFCWSLYLIVYFHFHTGRNIDEKYLEDCLALKCAVKINITCITLFGKDTELYILFQIHKAYELFFKLWSHTSWCMVQIGNTYSLIC